MEFGSIDLIFWRTFFGRKLNQKIIQYYIIHEEPWYFLSSPVTTAETLFELKKFGETSPNTYCAQITYTSSGDLEERPHKKSSIFKGLSDHLHQLNHLTIVLQGRFVGTQSNRFIKWEYHITLWPTTTYTTFISTRNYGSPTMFSGWRSITADLCRTLCVSQKDIQNCLLGITGRWHFSFPNQCKIFLQRYVYTCNSAV